MSFLILTLRFPYAYSQRLIKRAHNLEYVIRNPILELYLNQTEFGEFFRNQVHPRSWEQ